MGTSSFPAALCRICSLKVPWKGSGRQFFLKYVHAKVLGDLKVSVRIEVLSTYANASQPHWEPRLATFISELIFMACDTRHWFVCCHNVGTQDRSVDMPLASWLCVVLGCRVQRSINIEASII